MATIHAHSRSRLGRSVRPPEHDPALADDLAGQVRAAMDAFRRRYGRAPRVLCIGNVANNGYNNGYNNGQQANPWYTGEIPQNQ